MMKMFEISDIIMLAVLVVFLTIAYLCKKYGAPYFSALLEQLMASVDAEKLEEVKYWAGIFVKAAEMIFPGEKKGAEKKAYVAAQLEALGFSVDDKNNALIEAKVYEMNNTKAGE